MAIGPQGRGVSVELSPEALSVAAWLGGGVDALLCPQRPVSKRHSLERRQQSRWSSWGQLPLQGPGRVALRRDRPFFLFSVAAPLLFAFPGSYRVLRQGGLGRSCAQARGRPDTPSTADAWEPPCPAELRPPLVVTWGIAGPGPQGSQTLRTP